MKFIARIALTFCFAAIVVILVLLIAVGKDRHGDEFDNDYVDIKQPDNERQIVPGTAGNSFDRRINNYIHQYRLAWNYSLNESIPWTLAANWISSRRIYHEKPSELGECDVFPGTCAILLLCINYEESGRMQNRYEWNACSWEAGEAG
jgi:hypothetical protein